MAGEGYFAFGGCLSPFSRKRVLAQPEVMARHGGFSKGHYCVQQVSMGCPRMRDRSGKSFFIGTVRPTLQHGPHLLVPTAHGPPCIEAYVSTLNPKPFPKNHPNPKPKTLQANWELGLLLFGTLVASTAYSIPIPI